jgi:hypothetical protein
MVKEKYIQTNVTLISSLIKIEYMKKVVVILFSFLTILSASSEAQTSTGVSDTLAYLNNIVANKSLYIGQSFSVLADSFQISIKYFEPVASIHHKKNSEDQTFFAFYNSQTANDYDRMFPKLVIHWAPPFLVRSQSEAISKADSLGGWNLIAKAHYSNAIIADIRVFE